MRNKLNSIKNTIKIETTINEVETREQYDEKEQRITTFEREIEELNAENITPTEQIEKEQPNHRKTQERIIT